ncbi:BTB/POZ domain-containing protein At3g19850-like [Zingiber officinale]|uniref:BTB/POZ domain-containing protein At3g19850-like n=1 Tax=Zingiber officinale TaxID=94328 RepID=UPI001C4B13E2|nr:BTB/POZ domain-containing protein At3g19850-like [Zingiber officinale]
MQELCDLKVLVNDQHTFFLHQRVICAFSGKMRKLVKQENQKKKKKKSISVGEFPGGPCGFELVSRFCYNNGSIDLTPSNVALLHCSAVALDMADTLLEQTSAFLDGAAGWQWSDALAALRCCEAFFPAANSCGLIRRLISSLTSRIPLDRTASIPPPPSSSSSAASTSPESSMATPSDSLQKKEWWFDELAVLAPITVEEMARSLEAFMADNKSLLLTRFLLHYLKSVAQRPGSRKEMEAAVGGLAETAVHGVVAIGRSTPGAFSCRGLFWVLRVVTGLGVSREVRDELEKLMGQVLDQATLDDLLVSGHGVAFDVNLVVRLVRTFAGSAAGAGEVELQRMRKVGRLMDKYLGEICPDQSLKVGKFLEVAEALPDSARDCFDGVYRAMDIYLQSHPGLSGEEVAKLCRCLNYEKLTLESCKDLAKNRRIPPGIAVQALVSQRSKLHMETAAAATTTTTTAETILCSPAVAPDDEEEKERLREEMHRMERKVKELEKVCKSLKGQMTKMAKKSLSHGNISRGGMPKLC